MTKIVDEIKIENGKITTLISERQTGMTTYLCNLIKKLGYNNANYRILIVSHSSVCAEKTFKCFEEINEFNKCVEYCSINNLFTKLSEKRYDLIVFDCPNIHNDNHAIFHILPIMKKTKIVIGLTWENIAFDKDANKKVKDFVIKSDFAYYFTLTYDGKMIKYDICDLVKDDEMTEIKDI
jgi:hypothetical protein